LVFATLVPSFDNLPLPLSLITLRLADLPDLFSSSKFHFEPVVLRAYGLTTRLVSPTPTLPWLKKTPDAD
jgi:hypothetical protein